MQFTEHTIYPEGSALNVASGPENGPHLVLLHGVLRRWQDFVPLLPALTTRWTVHAMDFRGHGRSGPRPNRYRVVDYVGDVLGLLHHLSAPAVVYGHSLGAMTALAAASVAPDLCRAIVLEDPPFHTMGEDIAATPFLSQFEGIRPWAGSEEATDQVARALAEVRIKSPDGSEQRLGELRDMAALRFSASCLKDVDPEIFEPIVLGQWLELYTLEELIPGVRCPVLLMEADIDAGGMLTRQDGDRLESELPDVTRVRFPGAGHLLHWTHTAAVVRMTMGFLESLGEG